MGAFGGLILTNNGRALQAKAQAGATLNFNRIGIGDGSLSGQSISDLNALISEKKSLSITKLKTQTGGKAVVGAVLSNQDIVTGFYFRELGVFAQDPDVGEILYCYGNAGAGAEYIPAGGGPDIVEKNIDIVTIVGNASSVSATIESSLVFASQQDLDALAGAGRTTETVKGNADAIANHEADIVIHVTQTDKDNWNAKETPAGAQAKVDSHKNTATGAHPATAISIQDTEGHFVASDAEGALHELFTNVSDGKNSVASAITDMGQAASGSDTFATLATKIRDISDDANALVGEVLSTKTFYQGGTKKTGTMANRGAGGTVTPSTVNQVKSTGYYSSDITILGDADLVSANIKAGANIFGVAGNVNVVDTSPGTAVAADILSSKVAFVDGAQLTGSMTNRGAYNITPGVSNIVIPAGYHSGAGVVYGDADLIASNIRSGKTIFNVAGNLLESYDWENASYVVNTLTTATHEADAWIDITGSGYLINIGMPMDKYVTFQIDGGPIYKKYAFDFDKVLPLMLRFNASLKVYGAGVLWTNSFVSYMLD